MPRYDWAEIQAYYDAGRSYRECRHYFGFAAGSWTKAVERGALRARARSLPLAGMLERAKSRSAVKRRLLAEGVLQNICSICGIRESRGGLLRMHLDHINGESNDHRIENLRMLCPNCHSQTPTFAGRNVRRRKLARESARRVV